VLDPERTGRALDEINRQARRLGALISQLLDISRLQAGRLVLEPRLLDLVPAGRPDRRDRPDRGRRPRPRRASPRATDGDG
jgi:signal transduction histidine kinase